MSDMFDIPFGDEPIIGDQTGPYSTVPFMPLYMNKEVFCVVSFDDFVWASQWAWYPKPSKNGKKLYACRSARISGRYFSVYLHKEICFRATGMPPSPRHIIADHMNGNSLDCRRSNLRWATPSENRQNYHGIYAQQLRLAFLAGHDARLRRFQTRKVPKHG